MIRISFRVFFFGGGGSTVTWFRLSIDGITLVITSFIIQKSSLHRLGLSKKHTTLWLDRLNLKIIIFNSLVFFSKPLYVESELSTAVSDMYVYSQKQYLVEC